MRVRIKIKDAIVISLSALVLILVVVFWMACGNKADPASVTVPETSPTPSPSPTPYPSPSPRPTPSPSPSPTPEPTPDLTGKAINLLSGYYIDENAAKRRPFAVVINNLEKSLPQSGISQADIFYEVLSEGATTRIIAVFQDFDSAKIGSVRSARHYFIDFALDHDAIFVHFGGSPQAYSALKDLKINNINGIELDGGSRTSDFEKTTFWRDAERWKISAMREHSAFTSAANLMAQRDKSKYRADKAEDYEGMFNFFDDPADALADFENLTEAGVITVQYVSSTVGVFTYDSETGLYSRTQFGGKPQMDSETGEQITVSNVIVQITSVKPIPNDTEGRRDVALVGSGEGWLFTDGLCVPVKWSKKSHQSPTEWFFENGEKLTINKGKTWICVTDRQPSAEN